MPLTAAGVSRRTPAERADQRLAWQRSVQAFFAAGACHILAWACRDAYRERAVGLAAMRFGDDPLVSHVYATWDGWAFDHCGWHPAPRLLAVNAAFEGRPVERVDVPADLARFCTEQRHRLPGQYWRDPRPRARAYLASHTPPWVTSGAAGR